MNRFACIFFGTIFIFQAAAAWSADQGAGEKKRDRIVFGCTPDLPVDTLKQIHAPLMEYLGNELGMKAVFIVPKAYEELPRMMREKMVDVGIFAPNLYIQSKWAMPGMKYLVTVKKKNASLHNKSYIVSLKKSSIRSIEDLRGRRFGFSNSQSASGFVYPTAMLKAKKIDPNKYFSKTFFLKKHQKVILALVSGSIDAGATSEAALKSAHWGYGDIFHEIAESQDIPETAYAAGAFVPDALCLKIQDALIKLGPQSVFLEKIKHFDHAPHGFVIKKDSFYDSVRKTFVSSRLKLR